MTPDKRADVMRDLLDELWSGSYGFEDRAEVLDEQLPLHGISRKEWEDFFERRRPVERSLELVGEAGIFVHDLATYHGVEDVEMLKLVRIIGAECGADTRCRLRRALPGAHLAPSNPRS